MALLFHCPKKASEGTVNLCTFCANAGQAAVDVGDGDDDDGQIESSKRSNGAKFRLGEDERERGRGR